MAKKINTITSNNLNATVTFNAVDLEKARPGELYRSITVTPDNASGKTLNVSMNRTERKSWLNAIARYLFAGDDLSVSGFHRYHRLNPERLNGFWGWIRADKVPGKNGDTAVEKLMSFDGQLASVRLPIGERGGLWVVNFTTLWLRVEELGGSRFSLKNDTPEGNGVRLHSALDLLSQGVTVTVPVTFDSDFNTLDANGDPELKASVHQKAVRLAELIALAQSNGVDSAREEYFVEKRAIGGTIEAAHSAEKAEKKGILTPSSVTTIRVMVGGKPAMEDIDNLTKSRTRYEVLTFNAETGAIGRPYPKCPMVMTNNRMALVELSTKPVILVK